MLTKALFLDCQHNIFFYVSLSLSLSVCLSVSLIGMDRQMS